jgi:hypothetical protein
MFRCPSQPRTTEEIVLEVAERVLECGRRSRTLQRVVTVAIWGITFDAEEQFISYAAPAESIGDGEKRVIMVSGKWYTFTATGTVGDLRPLIAREHGGSAAAHRARAPWTNFRFEEPRTTCPADVAYDHDRGAVPLAVIRPDRARAEFVQLDDASTERTIINGTRPFASINHKKCTIISQIVIEQTQPQTSAVVPDEGELEGPPEAIETFVGGSVRPSTSSIVATEYAFEIAMRFAAGQRVIDARKKIVETSGLAEICDGTLIFSGKHHRDEFVLNRLRIGRSHAIVHIPDQRKIFFRSATTVRK